MWNDEREDRYLSGLIDGKRDRALCADRYYSAESDNADYIDGYDDGYDGLKTRDAVNYR